MGKRVFHILLRVSGWSTSALTLIVLLSARLGAFDSPLPANVVLADLAYQANTLKHIGDIIDPPLLDVENFDCVIKVDCLLRSCLKQVDELFSELNKAVFFPASSTSVILQETLRVYTPRVVDTIALLVSSTCQAAISLTIVACVVSIFWIFALAPLGGLQLNWLSLLRACLW